MHQKNKLTSHRSLEADRVHKTVSSLSQIYICFFLKCSRIPPIWEFKIYNNGKTQTLPQMLKEARPVTKYQPQRIQPVYKWISVGLMLLSMRRPAASDSTKCVQSKWLSSPILGWKLLPVHAQAESIDHDSFRDLYTFFKIWTLYKNRSRNFTETGTSPREKTLSSYERAGGKRRGKMLWLTKKKNWNKRKTKKIIIIKWKSKTESQNFKFEPATTFSPAFQTIPSHCVFLCPFFCHFGVSAKKKGGQTLTSPI